MRITGSRAGPSRRSTGCIAALLAAGSAVLPVPLALAQQVNRLDCRGRIYDIEGTISGERYYRPYNALGDGEVAFNGAITAGGIVGIIRYGGYTNAAFDGFIQSAAGFLKIAVLDNTGGRMIIYQGGTFVGAPPEIGAFACDWR